MPRVKGGKTNSKRHIERYEHTDKTRINNPPSGLVTAETDPPLSTHKTYDYIAPVPSVNARRELDYDPHLDPQLVWAGKKEHSSFEVPTVSLHVHERIDPSTIIEAVRKQNGMHCLSSRRCSSAVRRTLHCVRRLTSTATLTAG